MEILVGAFRPTANFIPRKLVHGLGPAGTIQEVLQEILQGILQENLQEILQEILREILHDILYTGTGSAGDSTVVHRFLPLQ